jgi:Leucine-rich repeat (LRR) protein
MLFRLLIVGFALAVATSPGQVRLTAAGRVFAGSLDALLTARGDFDAGGAVTPQGKVLVNGFMHAQQLTGMIPAQMGKMTALVQLALQDNSLSGTIPTQMGKMTALVQLYLHKNFLSGAIPPQLSRLSSLEVLWLHDNKLTWRASCTSAVIFPI